MKLKASPVVLLLSLCLSHCATTGEIDEYGRGVLKDAEYISEVFAVIRAVFRDGRLASYKVWPNMTSTSISGGFKRIR